MVSLERLQVLFPTQRSREAILTSKFQGLSALIDTQMGEPKRSSPDERPNWAYVLPFWHSIIFPLPATSRAGSGRCLYHWSGTPAWRCWKFRCLDGNQLTFGAASPQSGFSHCLPFPRFGGINKQPSCHPGSVETLAKGRLFTSVGRQTPEIHIQIGVGGWGGSW